MSGFFQKNSSNQAICEALHIGEILRLKVLFGALRGIAGTAKRSLVAIARIAADHVDRNWPEKGIARAKRRSSSVRSLAGVATTRRNGSSRFPATKSWI